MASSLDFQRIHERYQKEGLPHGVSIVDFCQRNGIVYKHYEKWWKNRNSVGIHPVSISNSPVEQQQQFSEQSTEKVPGKSGDGSIQTSSTLYHIRIQTSDGMLLQQRNLSYQKLVKLVEKLEVLC